MNNGYKNFIAEEEDEIQWLKTIIDYKTLDLGRSAAERILKKYYNIEYEHRPEQSISTERPHQDGHPEA